MPRSYEWSHSLRFPFQNLVYSFEHNNSISLYNAWAVSVSVSATNIPNTCKFRFIFIVYVCYCFAINTVFQAFFISYLVAPGYGKKFETSDELLHSIFAYGHNDATEVVLVSMLYKNHERFPYSRY